MRHRRPSRAVLVIDDNQDLLESMSDVLESQGYDVSQGASAGEAIEAVRDGHYGVILLDLHLPDASGLAIFEQLKGLQPDNRVIVMTGDASLQHVVAATRAGAFDFIVKSDDFVERVRISTRNAFEALDRDHQIASLTATGRRQAFPNLIAGSPEMEQVLGDIEKLGPSKVSVLVQGESGTGKEVAARAIHGAGQRSEGPFIAVNCAGIPDTLLESELFGYERGAFTGAVGRKIGRFEMADKGTIFLDEIGEMSLPLQAKLLRVLQDGTFDRLGGTNPVNVDVRVLSATNRDLTQMVAQGEFREDLYYRLAVFTLSLPPLRSRKTDIAPLARHFLKSACREEGKPEFSLSPEVLQLFRAHSWPGNVRQLQNVVKRTVVVSTGPVVTIHDLPEAFTQGLSETLDGEQEELRGGDWGQLGPSLTTGQRLDMVLERAFPDADLLPTMEDLEAAGIRLAMKRLDGNRKRTAERLMISRATLYRRLDPHGRVIRRKSGFVDSGEPATQRRTSRRSTGGRRRSSGGGRRRTSTVDNGDNGRSNYREQGKPHAPTSKPGDGGAGYGKR